jgi:hypothetical protein
MLTVAEVDAQDIATIQAGMLSVRAPRAGNSALVKTTVQANAPLLQCVDVQVQILPVSEPNKNPSTVGAIEGPINIHP